MIDTGRVPLSNIELDLYRQGISAAATGSLIEAIECYDRLLAPRGDFWEAWYERGTVLEDLGRFAEAIASYDKALALEPRREALANLWLRRGNTYQYGLGEYDASLACYDRVLQLQPDQVQGWHHRGNALLYGYNQPETAIICYRRALNIDPQLALAWRNQGNALMDLRRYSEAIVSYDHSLAISPNDEIATQARHQAQQELGLIVQAPETKPAWLVPESTEVHDPDALDQSIDHHNLTSLDLSTNPTMAASLLLEDEANFSFIELVEDTYTIGRDLDNKICLQSQFSSRFHAVIRRLVTETGEVVFEIQDGSVTGKASKNGILVNGKHVTRAFLNHQDLIVFGPRAKAIFRAF
ncbi:MAG: tetratricopeptide repeat protein [Alkalinema sp. CAN_BIN05]|nr:tetratricopeptide repeat protein [Alkalinema sp. CAN_BIN05]